MIKRHYIKRMEVYLVVIVALLPLLITDMVFRHIMVLAGTYGIAALGLSLFMGYAGQISIGHSAFFGIGAYGMAVFSGRCGFPSTAALACAAALSGLAALVIGRPILKLREYFLALATIGLVQIFQVVVTELDGLTGGVAGISDIPWFSVFGFELDTPLSQFYLVWGLLYILFMVSRNLVHSRFGRASVAVALNEDASMTVGIDPGSLKLKLFVFSAVLSGIGGALFASVITSVSPGSFGLNMSVILVMMVIIGGMGSLFGAIAGAVFLSWIMNMLSGYQEYSLPLFGAVLILILLFLPEGIFRGIGSRWIDLVRNWADEDWRKELDR